MRVESSWQVRLERFVYFVGKKIEDKLRLHRQKKENGYNGVFYLPLMLARNNQLLMK
jgi:hypothetical protein